ncbi:hypothetical protein [Fluviispira vulneris]|uniref:hypothetical protein n=1 Tax=Fluviispira vulneris TaxID=2763012 RepID=UPI001647D8D2|nr:hypothetical protein [Fluviispira vulneris]
MWYPDIKIDSWLKKYPALKEKYPKICTCGEIRNEAVPFVSDNWVGLKYSRCKCGKLSSRASIPRSEKLRKELMEIILNL